MSTTTNPLDNTSTIFTVDNLQLDGNSITAQNLNGNVNITPNGSGSLVTTKIEGTQLSLDPGASGDSFVQFDINATGEFRIGVDDDDGDAFKISQGSALGTNDTFIMSAAGERTMPLQPAFLAIAANATNVTGNGAVYQLGTAAMTEVFDQNGDFNTNGTFTAPVTGKFTLSASASVTDCTASQTCQIALVTSNRTIAAGQSRPASGNDINALVTTITDMDGSDTAVVTVTVSGEAGDTDDINGPGTYYSGALTC